MPRPKTRYEIIDTARDNYYKLMQFIDSMTEEELNTPFDFSGLNKKEAHWNRDRNLRDVLVHLYEWHRLLINWLNANVNEVREPFLPAPYNWKTYGEMNMMLWKKHQSTSLGEAKRMLEGSHRKVVSLVSAFNEKELFDKGYYDWTGSSTLGSYFISVTSSHYDWALKKLKAHRKVLAKKQ